MLKHLTPSLLLLLSYKLNPASGKIDEILWTEDEESSLLTDEEHRVAFRDVVLEEAARRVIETLLLNSKMDPSSTRIPQSVRVPNPLYLPDVYFSKAVPALFDIDFEAWNLELSGLQDLRIKNLHVIRHLGLNDIRVVVQLETNLRLNGSYNLSGTGLSLIPLTGNGSLTAEVDDFMVTGEMFFVFRENKLFIRRPFVTMTEKDLRVDLENITKTLQVGDILKTVGEDLLFDNRDKLAELVMTKVIEIADAYLVF